MKPSNKKAPAVTLAAVFLLTSTPAAAQASAPAAPTAPGPLAPPPPLGSTPATANPGGPTNGAGGGTGQDMPKSYDSDLDKSKEEDSGRGLSWFWVEAFGGFEHVGLHTFNVDEQALSAGFVDTQASGGMIEAGIGAQLFVVTLGVRGRMGFFPDYQIGRIGGELGFRIPIGFVEPRFDLGGGYAALGAFDSVVPESISVRGGYARAGAGVDFYPASVFSIGAKATFDFMALSRPELPTEQIEALRAAGVPISDEAAQLLALEGAGYGTTFTISGGVGLHF